MSTFPDPTAKKKFCVFCDLGNSREPSFNQLEDDSNYATAILHDTELQAQREIADHMISRLQAFVEGHYDDYTSATECEDYVLPVTVLEGNFQDEDGNTYPLRYEH